jgi:BirA family biotin operon repressor/biotin-[acetyl-CoA-carboxylase] ligase
MLRLLAADRFESGQQLAAQLGCSRATVHNVLSQAATLGVKVHAVRGRGYRLAREIDWLDAERIGPRLAQRGIQWHLHALVDSTSSVLQRAVPLGLAHRSVAVAEIQTAGRGRRGRSWLGAPGDGLAFSLLWRTTRCAAELSGLSLAVGVMLVTCLREWGLKDVGVKWPNDILVGEAKLAGVLIELSGDLQGPSAAVIGIGLNLRAGEELSAATGQAVTDLHSHLPPVNRSELLVALVEALDDGLLRFEQAGFAAFQAAWQDCHLHQGLDVALFDTRGLVTRGRARGVDAQGALLIETAGGVLSFHTGEVSLRRQAT